MRMGRRRSERAFCFCPLPLPFAQCLSLARMAPAALHPIVIPPIVVDKFSCLGEGLLFEGHARESPAALRDLLLPKGTKNGLADRDRPKAWWRGAFPSSAPSP